jgi:hypothetical protein
MATNYTGPADSSLGGWLEEAAVSWEEKTFSTAKEHFDRFLGQLSDRDLLEELGGGRTYDTMKKENVSVRLMRRFATEYLLDVYDLSHPENEITRMQAERYLWSINGHIRRDLELANNAAMESIRFEMAREFARKHLFDYLLYH